MLADGVDPHPVLAHVEHAVGANVVIRVVVRAEMLRYPADLRRQAIQPVDRVLVAAQRREIRRPIAGDVAAVDCLGVGLPIVGDDAIPQQFGHPRHDAAAGEEIDETSPSLRKIAGIACCNQLEQFALVADVRDELIEEIFRRVRRRVMLPVVDRPRGNHGSVILKQGHGSLSGKPRELGICAKFAFDMIGEGHRHRKADTSVVSSWP